MGADKNRDRARDIVERVMDGETELLDGRHLDELSRKALGSVGEELAACYLESRGYEIIERNYRCPEGEADLVVYDASSEQVVLVEVKTRRPRGEGAFPEEAVTPAKQARYRRIAYQFAAEHYPCPAIRFDVVAVTFSPAHIGEIRHLYAAFDWEAGR